MNELMRDDMLAVLLTFDILGFKEDEILSDLYEIFKQSDNDNIKFWAYNTFIRFTFSLR